MLNLLLLYSKDYLLATIIISFALGFITRYIIYELFYLKGPNNTDNSDFRRFISANSQLNIPDNVAHNKGWSPNSKGQVNL